MERERKKKPNRRECGSWGGIQKGWPNRLKNCLMGEIITKQETGNEEIGGKETDRHILCTQLTIA